MNLEQVFNFKKNNLLNIYCTAGYPNLKDLPTVLKALHEAEVDMVEIGIPYSDPLSDGPTIQASNSRALKNGITLKRIFDQLEQHPVPIAKIMMGYFNSVFQFGIERFCRRCQEVGVSAVILPDLPLEIFIKKYKKTFDDFGLSMIFLITPETSEERIRQIDQLSTSFIYAVSQSGTTGKTQGLEFTRTFLGKIKNMNLKNPIMMGFSISQPEDLTLVHQYVNGAIIGSAFIRQIEKSTDLKKDITSFIQHITQKQFA